MAGTLAQKHCTPCEGGAAPLDEATARSLLGLLEGWTLAEGRISKNYAFKNYYHTISFVNAVAWMANREGHHPDLEVSYNRCVVHFTTHALGGLSENDFICAAKVDALFSI